GLSVLWMPVIAATAAVSSPASAQNLVSNPGFETVSDPVIPGLRYCQAASWTSSGICTTTYEYEAGFRHSGSYALLFGSSLFGAADASQSIGGLQAGRYDFAFWYRVVAPGAGGNRVSIGGQTFSIDTSAATTAFVQFNQQLTLGPGSTTIDFTDGFSHLAIDDV